MEATMKVTSVHAKEIHRTHYITLDLQEKVPSFTFNMLYCYFCIVTRVCCMMYCYD